MLHTVPLLQSPAEVHNGVPLTSIAETVPNKSSSFSPRVCGAALPCLSLSTVVFTLTESQRDRGSGEVKASSPWFCDREQTSTLQRKSGC